VFQERRVNLWLLQVILDHYQIPPSSAQWIEDWTKVAVTPNYVEPKTNDCKACVAVLGNFTDKPLIWYHIVIGYGDEKKTMPNVTNPPLTFIHCLAVLLHKTVW